jgi:hypothetical protein
VVQVVVVVVAHEVHHQLQQQVEMPTQAVVVVEDLIFLKHQVLAEVV